MGRRRQGPLRSGGTILLALGSACGSRPAPGPPPPACLTIVEAQARTAQLARENEARFDARLAEDGLVRAALTAVPSGTREDGGDWRIVDRTDGGRTLLSPLAHPTCDAEDARSWTLAWTPERQLVAVYRRAHATVSRAGVCGCDPSACGSMPPPRLDGFDLPVDTSFAGERTLDVGVEVLVLEWRNADGSPCEPAP